MHISLLIQTRLHFHWTMHFSLHEMLIVGLELYELLVDYCDVFINCLDSHSDGRHSLQRIHWWAIDVMLNVSKSWIAWGYVHFEEIFIFGWTVSSIIKDIMQYVSCSSLCGWRITLWNGRACGVNWDVWPAAPPLLWERRAAILLNPPFL